ncbi:2OG-Fe(II) oxygenase [Streptomyces sp. NPDC040724]|uniref:2OG-Fe(II) oxygenase n=1 Tax=Streptomyces sp. NPDC040724 TaxID=3155612 RepID=UPI0033C6CA90
MITEPFPHCELGPDSIMSGAAVSTLLNTFPAHLMRGATLRDKGGDKDYYVDHLAVFDRGRWKVRTSELAPLWQRLLRYLAGEQYAAGVRALLGLGEVPMSIEVRLSSYPSGGWMSRHTDRADKLFSHNIYLCPGWDPAWGGGLALYGSGTDPDAARVVLPGAGNSVAFRRSDASWHEVMPVSPDSARPRRAVLIHGYEVRGHHG